MAGGLCPASQALPALSAALRVSVCSVLPHSLALLLILSDSLSLGGPPGGVGAGTSSTSFAVLFPTQGRARAVSSAGQMTALSLS